MSADMTRKLMLLVSMLILLVCLSGCTKRCRCQKFNQEIVYFSKEQVSAEGKTCNQMKFRPGMFTQYYSYCEWVYGD